MELKRSGTGSRTEFNRAGMGGAGDDAGRRLSLPVSGVTIGVGGGWFSLSGAGRARADTLLPMCGLGRYSLLASRGR